MPQDNPTQETLLKIRNSYIAPPPKKAPTSLALWAAQDESKVKAEAFTDTKVSDIYAKVGDKMISKYPTFLSYRDNEEYFAQKQDTGEKWANGTKKFLGQVLTGVVGGTIGTVGGIVEGIRQGSLEATYNNDFMNYLDDLNKKMSYELPNYYTKAEKEASFTGSLGSANFWANDVLGGAAFTVSAIGSEALWGLATGGASIAPALARRGAQIARVFNKVDDLSYINKAKDIAKGGIKYFKDAKVPKTIPILAGKAGSLANVARFTLTSAGYESGFEARHYMNEMRDSFYNDFYEKNQRAPEAEEIADFERNLTKSANTLFGFNMAIVGSSNLVTIGRVFDLKSPISAPTKWTNAKMFGMGVKKTAQGTLEQLTPNKLQKFNRVAWGVSRSPLIEGVWEEGMQSVGNNTAQNWTKAGYDPKYTENTLSLSEAFNQGLSDTYGTKEGMKEVGIGMLIGLFTGTGINLAKGRGLLGEFKEGDEQAKGLAANYNYYSPTRVAEIMKLSGRMQKSTEDSENSEVRGDFTAGELARKEAMISQLNFGYNFDYTDSIVKDTEFAIENIDDEAIKTTYGVDDAGAKELKQKMINEYKQTAKAFKKNRDFAEYFISSDLKKEGLSASEAKLVKEAVAYELTMGEGIYEFNQDVLSKIKEKVASTYQNQNLSSAVDVDNILMQATEQTQREFENKKTELVKLNTTLSQLEQKRKQLELTTLGETPEATKRRLDKLTKVTTEINQAEQDKVNLEAETNTLLATANAENPFAKSRDVQYVTAEEITQLEENLAKVKSGAGIIRNSNPQEVAELQKLIEEYGRSITATKRYAELAQQLANPKLGLRGRRNIISEIRGAGVSKEDTEVFLEQLNPTIAKLVEEYKTVAVESNEEVKDAVDEAKKTTIPTKKVEVVVPQDKKAPATVLEEIKEIVNSNPYLLKKYGKGNSPKQPTEEEVGEFYDLSTRTLNDPNINRRTINFLNPHDKKRLPKTKQPSLTRAEIERLQELNDLMSDWQLLEGAFNGEGISLKDLILEQVSLDTPSSSSTQEAEDVTDKDLAEMTNPNVVESDESVMNEQIVQTYENAFVRKTQYGYTFHNINLQTLLGDKVSAVTVVDKNRVAKEILPSEIKDNRIIGNTFLVTLTNGEQVEVLLDLGAVLRIKDQNQFNNLMSVTGTSAFKYAFSKNSGYSTLYQNDKPVKSDFEIGDTNRRYSPEEAYNLNQNDIVGFEVNLNDSYNKQIMSDTALSDAEKRGALKIYVVDSRGNIVGDLKSEERTGKSSEFLALRQKAFNMAKKANTGSFTVPFTTTVAKVYLGVPNFEIKSDGVEATPVQFDLTDRALEEIVDYGYIENGEVVLKNNSSGVRLTYVAKLLKKNGTPVVVFKKGEYLVAFPANLRKTSAKIGDKINEIIDNSDNPVKVATEINKLLSAYGLNKKNYNIQYVNSKNNTLFNEDGTFTENVNKAIADLNELKDYADVTAWDSTHDKNSLKEEITLPLNLEDVTLTSPKVVIRFDEMIEVSDNVYDRFQQQGEDALTNEEVLEFANKAIADEVVVKDLAAQREGYSSLENAIFELESAVERATSDIEGYTLELLNKKNDKNVYTQIEGDVYLTDKGVASIVRVPKGILNTPGGEFIIFYGDDKVYKQFKVNEAKKTNGSIDYTNYISNIRKIEEKLSGTESIDVISAEEFKQGNQKTIKKADVRNIVKNLSDARVAKESAQNKTKGILDATGETKLSPEDFTITQTNKVQNKVKQLKKIAAKKTAESDEKQNEKCN